MKRYVYTDPTGAGDDVILEMPQTWLAPTYLRIGDAAGELYTFGLDGEEDSEDELD